MKPPKCSVKGCESRPVKLGLCNAHLRVRAEIWKSNSKPQEKPKKSVSKRKASGDLEFFRRLYLKWVDEGHNYCIECGIWLPGEVWNMAHVVGDGEAGGNRAVAEDEDNIVPACRDHHTQMDNAVGRTRKEMKCWPELERIRCLIVSRHNLKCRSGCE